MPYFHRAFATGIQLQGVVGGAMEGLGGYSLPSEHASPLKEGDNYFFGDTWYL